MLRFCASLYPTHGTGFFLFFAPRCLGKFRTVRPSVSKAKETTGMYNEPLNKCPKGEYQGADKDEVYERWYQAQYYMEAYKVMTRPFCINVEAAIAGFNIENIAAKKAIRDAKTWQVANQRGYLPDQRATPSRCQRCW